jgi:hypothetical protein
MLSQQKHVVLQSTAPLQLKHFKVGSKMAMAASAPVLPNQKERCCKIAQFTDAPYTNIVMWDPTENINKNYNVVLWVTFYLQFESVFSLMMDYFIPKHGAFFEDLCSCVGLIMWCCLDAWANKRRKKPTQKTQWKEFSFLNPTVTK